MAGGHARARSPGRAGGGRAARWIAPASPPTSRPSPPPASAAWRSRPSTARAARRRATSISCRRAGWKCSSTRRAKPRAWGWASTWPPAPAGPSAARRRRRRMARAASRSLDGVLAGTPTAMKVKRAAPGGEGLVLDPYSTDALERYLAPFSSAFAEVSARRQGCAAQFHDSFEYYNAELVAGVAGGVPGDAMAMTSSRSPRSSRAASRSTRTPNRA